MDYTFLSFFYSKQFLLAFISTLSITTLFIWCILRSKVFNRFLDIPNKRSLHIHPKLRLGGFAIIAAIIISIFIYSSESIYLIPFLLTLIVLSFLDDLFSVKPFIRLTIQLLTTFIFLYTLDLQISYLFFNLLRDPIFFITSLLPLLVLH